MNSWIRESVKLANGHGYLDKLQDVYPVEIGEKRTIPPEKAGFLKKAFDDGSVAPMKTF